MKALNMTAKTLLTTATLTGVLFAAPMVSAEENQDLIEQKVCTTVPGQYGDTQKCEIVKVPREKIIQGVTDVTEPDQGLGDLSLLELGLYFGAAGAVFFALSKLTRRVYLFD